MGKPVLKGGIGATRKQRWGTRRKRNYGPPEGGVVCNITFKGWRSQDENIGRGNTSREGKD